MTLLAWLSKLPVTDQCIPFKGYTGGRNGYGTIRINGKTHNAHRTSFELNVRKLSEGEVVMHECDNPACVNPKHLKAGTQADNIHDCMAKGRFVPGTANLARFKHVRGERVRIS